MRPRSIAPQQFVLIPYPFNVRSYFFPTPYLEAPVRQAKRFRYPHKPTKKHRKKPTMNTPKTLNGDIQNPIKNINLAGLKTQLESLTTTTTSTTQKPTKEPDLIDTIIDEVVEDDEETTEDDDDDDYDDDDDDDSDEDANRSKNRLSAGALTNNYINNLYKNVMVVPKTPTIKRINSKMTGAQKPTNSTDVIRIYNPFRRKKITDKESIVEAAGQEVSNTKGPFGIFARPAETALKEGGIVIQRLRVRQGGIAIAGPGGVATAGSGGTAIVGPGGIALTHPRGLAIAGPGARVFSVPSNVDLTKIAYGTTTKGRSLSTASIEGATIVATGPVVYYNAGPI